MTGVSGPVPFGTVTPAGRDGDREPMRTSPESAEGATPADPHPRAADRGVATFQRPPVARTIASAIARPEAGALRLGVGRPVEAVEDLRPLGLAGCPGPQSSTVSATRGPSPATVTSTGRPPARTCRRCRARTPSSRSSQLGRRRDHDRRRPVARRRASVEAARLRDGREPVGRLAASIPRSTGSAVRRPLGRVEAGQPEHVLEQPPHPLRLAVDARERRAVPGGVALLRPARGEVWASMTDSGVRSSCEASAVNSSWRWRARPRSGAATRRPIATAPRNTTPSRNGAMSELAEDDVRWRVAHRLQRLADHDTRSSPTAGRRGGAPSRRGARSPARATVASSAGSAGVSARRGPCRPASTAQTSTGAPSERSARARWRRRGGGRRHRGRPWRLRERRRRGGGRSGR